MTIGEVLATLGQALDATGIDWMVGGSVASSTWGEIRSTQDIDVVVVANRTSLVDLCRALPSDRWYADPDMAIEAARRRSMFNIIDLESGWKIDIILQKGRAFSRAEFTRRRRTELDGTLVWMASPEDVILTKLEWAKATGSERQIRDAAGIVAVQGSALDGEWLAQWAKTLGVDDLLARIYAPPL